MPRAAQATCCAQTAPITQSPIGSIRPGLLGHGDELARRHEPAALGVVPAQQRLDADELAASPWRRSAGSAAGTPRPRARAAGGRPSRAARAGRGPVWANTAQPPRAVSLAWYMAESACASSASASRASRGASAMPIEAEIWNSASAIMNGSASVSAICAATRCGGLRRVVVQVGEQEQEAVAARPGQQVGRPHRGLEPRGEPADQLVAGAVAERVVDQLEVVDVELQQRDAGPRAARAGQRELEVLLQQRPVRQPGERVVVGEVGDLLLGRPGAP